MDPPTCDIFVTCFHMNDAILSKRILRMHQQFHYVQACQEGGKKEAVKILTRMPKLSTRTKMVVGFFIQLEVLTTNPPITDLVL